MAPSCPVQAIEQGWTTWRHMYSRRFSCCVGQKSTTWTMQWPILIRPHSTKFCIAVVHPKQLYRAGQVLCWYLVEDSPAASARNPRLERCNRLSWFVHIRPNSASQLSTPSNCTGLGKCCAWYLVKDSPAASARNPRLERCNHLSWFVHIRPNCASPLSTPSNCTELDKCRCISSRRFSCCVGQKSTTWTMQSPILIRQHSTRFRIALLQPKPLFRARGEAFPYLVENSPAASGLQRDTLEIHLLINSKFFKISFTSWNPNKKFKGKVSKHGILETHIQCNSRGTTKLCQTFSQDKKKKNKSGFWILSSNLLFEHQTFSPYFQRSAKSSRQIWTEKKV